MAVQMGLAPESKQNSLSTAVKMEEVYLPVCVLGTECAGFAPSVWALTGLHILP